MLLCLITSCTRFFDYEFKISNHTQSEITVEYFEVERNTMTRTMLKPNSTKTLLIASRFRCNPMNREGSRINSVDSTLTPFINYIDVFKGDSTRAKTNFNNEFNWEFESRKSLGIYHTKIKEVDF